MKMANNRRQNCKRNTDNSMTISKKPLRYAWRPNNYRRQTRIKTLSDSGINFILSTIKKSKISQKNIITIKDYSDNITIQITKNNLIIIYKQEYIKGLKSWHEITGDTMTEVEQAIQAHKDHILSLMQSSADYVIEQAKLTPVGVFEWSRHEDAIRGDDFIDSLPADAVIHGKHFKKVYPDQSEFIGFKSDNPTAKMYRYIHNRVVERFTPDIAREINNLSTELKLFNGDVKRFCQDNIKEIDDVNNFSHIIPYLSVDKRLIISDYLIEHLNK